MSINTDYYGPESSWIPYTTDPAAKYVTYTADPAGGLYGTVARGTLSDFHRVGKLELNEFIDTSCCYAGMGPNADICSVRWINRQGDSMGQIRTTSATPFFLGTSRIYNSEARAQSIIVPATDTASWGMERTDETINGAGMINNDGSIAPIVKLSGRSVVLLICVLAAVPGSTEGSTTSAAFMTLNDYIADYENTGQRSRICGIYAIPYIVSNGVQRTRYMSPMYTAGQGMSLATITLQTATVSDQQLMHYSKTMLAYPDGRMLLSGRGGTTGSAAEVGVTIESNSSAIPIYGNIWHPMTASYGSGYFRIVWAYADINADFGGINSFKEYCYKQAAYLGLFFTGDADLARSLDDENLLNDGMYLGIIDSDGVTRGRYTHGTINKDQPQYNSEDLIKNSTYNPEKPTPTPLPEDTVIGPNDPKISIAGKGSKLFILRPNDIDNILDSMYGVNEDDWDALIKGLALQGSDPLGAIISYRAYMWPYTSTVSSPIYLGRTQITDEYYPVLNDNIYKQTAYFQLADDENFITSRHLMARLFLPLYGWYQLPIDRIISQQLKVDLRYKAPDDLGCYIISFGDVVYDIVDFQPFIDIPISGRAGGYKELGQSLGTTFSKIATGAGSIIQGLLNKGSAAALGAGMQASGNAAVTAFTAPAVAKKQSDYSVPFRNGSSSTMLYLPMFPFIQFYKQKTIKEYNDPGYIKTTGIACDVWRTLGGMPENSLLQINNPVLNDYSNMKTEEINELNSILTSGFYR